MNITGARQCREEFFGESLLKFGRRNPFKNFSGRQDAALYDGRDARLLGKLFVGMAFIHLTNGRLSGN